MVTIKAAANRKIVIVADIRNRSNMTRILKPKIHDSPDREKSYHHIYASPDDQIASDRVLKEHPPVTRINKIHSNKDHKRKRQQNPTSPPGLRGSDSHLSGNTHPLANYFRRLVQNLGQIASRFFLHQNPRDEKMSNPGLQPPATGAP